MVLIPAGEFQMGSSDLGFTEVPVHTVYTDAFYMDMYEVTNAQYKKFVDGTGHSAPLSWHDEHYYKHSPRQNPTGPSVDIYRVIRGGSWANDPDLLHVADRGLGSPWDTLANVGFRCVVVAQD